MGRDTGGVRGMNVAGEGNEVLAMDVARDDQELLVVTENGFGKRTRDRRVPQDVARRQGRADDQVHRARAAAWPAALVVREHQELVFISQEGMVQRTGVRGIRQTAARRRA